MFSLEYLFQSAQTKSECSHAVRNTEVLEKAVFLVCNGEFFVVFELVVQVLCIEVHASNYEKESVLVTQQQNEKDTTTTSFCP